MPKPHAEVVECAKGETSATKAVAPVAQSDQPPATVQDTLKRIAAGIEALNDTLLATARAISRIADHVSPPPSDILDSPSLARLLDCTTTWVAEMAREGQIPASCIVPGTGNGKPWKFRREAVERWLATR